MKTTTYSDNIKQVVYYLHVIQFRYALIFLILLPDQKASSIKLILVHQVFGSPPAGNPFHD